MKKHTTIILLFFGCLSAIAQHSISGEIIDENNETIPFANVILHQKNSTKSPKGTVSDDNGKYIFKNIKPGTYQIEVSVLGFKTEKSTVFQLSSDKKFNFVLKEESQSLDEIVIKAKRPIIRQTAEKLVVDLEKSAMVNSSLSDVMRKVPGILVTENGISVAGNTGVRILINGKTTEYMDVKTLLRDLPADNIAKVEVVEQPGAEYEASGSGAVINIILKKNVSLGTNGSLGFWAGKDDGFEYGTSASVANYKNKLNWQASAGYSNPTWREDVNIIRKVQDESYNQLTVRPYKPKNFRVSSSIDYYLNPKNSIGIGVSWRKRLSERIAKSTTVISDNNKSETLLSENNFLRDRIIFNINPYYEYKTETDRLLLDINYINYGSNNTNDLYDVAGSEITYQDRRYLEDGKYTIKAYKADYSKSFSDNLKLSFGSKIADVSTDNDLKLYQHNSANEFVFKPELSSRFLIDETILAVYSKINAKVNDWSFSGGLRYENSNTKGTSDFIKNGKPTTETKERIINKLFPSAAVSRKITEKLGASLSYSYRIRRPSYSSLNSFETFLDPLSSEIGNPNLKPAFTNNYQFNLTFSKQPFFTIGYSQTEDAIFDLIQQENTTKRITRQVVNVESNNNWNFRLFAPLSFIKIKGLEGYTGIIVVNTDYKSKKFGLFLNKWNTYSYTQINYKLPLNINFELSGLYGTGALEGQMIGDWIAELDFSFSKKFMDDRLKANLSFNKMLNRGFVGRLNYKDLNATANVTGTRQSIKLQLIYSFGSKFGKKKSKRNSSKDEENRIQDEN